MGLSPNPGSPMRLRRPIGAALATAVTLMRVLILIMAVCFASQSFAGTIVKDGATLSTWEVTYRLDGIDAPELDQICIDEHADPGPAAPRPAIN